jgi:hypothetical protein
MIVSPSPSRDLWRIFHHLSSPRCPYVVVSLPLLVVCRIATKEEERV